MANGSEYMAYLKGARSLNSDPLELRIRIEFERATRRHERTPLWSSHSELCALGTIGYVEVPVGGYM